MGWLQKTPLVSLLFAVAIAAVPFLLGEPSPGAGARFDNAREAARSYFVRNPTLHVDAVGELVLDGAWLAETRAEAIPTGSAGDVRLPPRLLARSQARLDSLIDEAYVARMSADPAWRLGVLDHQTPARNYIAHAFVHEAMMAVGLCIAVFLIVGIPLERSWGSPIFALFVLTSIPLTAEAYRALDGASGVPWSGSAGLAGALLGAYFIRGLGGRLVLPGWVLLPAWIATEAFLVRGVGVEELGSLPWATFCAAVALGAATAGVLRLLNVEARVDAISSSRRGKGPNPVVARAARMRSDGDPYQAFDLIQAAWRDDPEDLDVSETFFSIAVEVGQPEAASEAILPSLRAALRKGEFTRAADYWYPLASKRCDVALEPTAFVRLGEVLLDASHPEEALFSLQGAIDAGVSSAGAARIVNIARDLDPDLTRTAAEIALADPTIEGHLREELERLVASSKPEAPAASPAPPPGSHSQLDRRVQAEHQPVETTAFPLELDSDVEPPDVAETNEEALAAQALDVGALSAERLGSEPAPVPDVAPVDSGDVLSHWNDPSALAADALAGAADDPHEAMSEEALFEVDDLETPESGFDFHLRSVGADQVDPRDDQTDTDLTPIMDATDELTSPIAGGGEEDTSTAVFGPSGAPTATAPEAPTTFLEVEETLASDEGQGRTAFPATEAGGPEPLSSADEEATPVAPARSDIAFAPRAAEGATTILTRRPLKAVGAVPVGAGDDWIEIDAEGRGKSRLPLHRIQAIAIGAVDGLGPRPVLVIDFVLNWRGDDSEVLKSIRIRSDRFDPLVFSPGAANPLEALTRWIRALEASTGANCLPTRDVLAGRFGRFGDLEAYERDVLLAKSGA